MITNVYIDGFNLYYRALKDTPFRWLDLRKLAEALFPEDAVNRASRHAGQPGPQEQQSQGDDRRRDLRQASVEEPPETDQLPDTLMDGVGVIGKPAGW